MKGQYPGILASTNTLVAETIGDLHHSNQRVWNSLNEEQRSLLEFCIARGYSRGVTDAVSLISEMQYASETVSMRYRETAMESAAKTPKPTAKEIT